MNAWDELVTRCALRRREKIGPLSDQAFEELLLAVRSNPTGFVDHPSEQALLLLARALDAYRESCRDDDVLDDDDFQIARERRLSALVAACRRAAEADEGCVDALLVGILAQELDPDPLVEGLLDLERRFECPAFPQGGDAWDDVFLRPRLRLRAALARACAESARFRMAMSCASSVMDAAPSDPLGARYTHMLASARLEDEAAFEAVCARFGHAESAWSHLARVLLLYKLGRMPAARRALRGFDGLCEGGAFALLRPAYVDLCLPDRPEAAACSFEECLIAVRESEPIIADVPDFINWCQGHDWLVASAQDFAERRGLDW